MYLVVAGRRQRGWFPRRCAHRLKQHECDNGNVSNVDSDDDDETAGHTKSD